MANRYEIILEAQDKASRDLQKITAQLEKTESTSLKAAKALGRIGGSIGSAGFRTATTGLKSLTVAATAATAAFVTFGVKSLNAIDRLGKASTRLGVSAQFLSEYSAVADRAGISTQQFETGMQRFLRRLGQAQLGTGELVKPLERMGISIRDVNGNFREGTDVFDEFIGKLSNTGTETQQLANAMGAFDTEGVAFINVAKMGATEIDKIRQNARDAGLVIDDKLIRATERAKDKITDLTDIGKGFGLQFFGSLAEPLETFANDLKTKINNAVKNAGGMEAFAKQLSGNFLNGLADFLAAFSRFTDTVLDGLKTVVNAINTLLTKLPKSVIGVDFEFAPDLGDFSSIDSMFSHAISDLRVMEDMLKDSAKFATAGYFGTGARVPANDAAKQLVETQEELARLEALRESYNEGTLKFLNKQVTGLGTVESATAGVVEKLRGFSEALTSPSTAGGGEAAKAALQKTIDDQKAAADRALANQAEAAKKAEQLSKKQQQSYALYAHLRLLQLRDEQKEEARVQAAGIAARRQYAALRLQGFELDRQKEAEIQARTIAAHRQYGKLRIEAERQLQEKLERQAAEAAVRSRAAYRQYAESRLEGLRLEQERAQQVINANADMLTSDQQTQIALASKQELLDKVNKELETNVALTKQQKEALLELQSALSLDITNLGIFGSGVQGMMTRLEGIRDLKNDTQEYITVLRDQLNATDEELRQLGLLPPAKKANLTATQALTKAIQDENTKLANLRAGLARVNEISKETGISVAKLTKEFNKQIDALTPAANAAEEFARNYAAQRDEFADLTALQNNQAEISKLAAQYGVSERKIVAHLRKMRYNMGEFYDAGTSVGQMVKDHFQDLGDGLASNLTNALMNGKQGFESFKDYLKGWAQHLMSSIIEKLLIQPMIDQMTNMLGLTNKVVPTIAQQLGGMGGGAGAGGGLLGGLGALAKPMQGPMQPGGGLFGGGFGSFLSGAWGGISNFFSGLWGGVSNFFSGLFGGFFADGGYLPAGKIGVVGEAGPELITGPANITPMSGGGEPVVVNFNISAIDTQSGTEFIMKNRKQITGVIQDAYNRRGKQGVY